MKSSVADVRLALSYYGALEGDRYDAFMKAARNPAISESFSFFHTTDIECPPFNGIFLSRNFDEYALEFEMNTEDELVAFAKANSLPQLITFGDDYIDAIFTDLN